MNSMKKLKLSDFWLIESKLLSLNENKTNYYKDRIHIDKDSEYLFEKIDMNDGDEFMAVLPWHGAIKEPEFHDPPSKKAPDETYNIQYVYGIRTEETRENVHFSSTGKIIYMTAALGIINDHLHK